MNNNIPKPETDIQSFFGSYSPAEIDDEVLGELDRYQLSSLIIAELERVARQPATGRAAALELLFASAQWKKLGQPRGWAEKILTTLVSNRDAKAREAAILAARQNGTMSKSDELWMKKATAVHYALPEGVLVEAKNGNGGLWLQDVTGDAIGPCVYPKEEMENGTIRFTGWDRWGRPVRDLVIAFADLQSPKKCQTKLSSIGARMDSAEMWCALVVEIMRANDLRVPDPEPCETANEELQRLQAAAIIAGGWLAGDITWCPMKEFEKQFGHVPLATRRRWAEKGWLIRDADSGRYTHTKSHGGAAPSRHYGFQFPVEDSKLKFAPGS